MTTLEYLQKVKKMEASVYEQKNIVQSMKRTVNRVRGTPLEKAESTESVFEGLESVLDRIFDKDTWGALLIGPYLLYALFALVTFLFEGPTLVKIREAMSGFSGVLGWYKGCYILCLVSTVIYIIYVFFRNQNRNKKVKLRNKQIQIRNEAEMVRIEEKAQGLQMQLSAAQQNLNQSMEILSKLYSINIIHPKYQNLIAVCSFCEYLETGRCNTLEGHEGAYNLFESELRLNQILIKMDDVISRLDEISATQHELYTEMRECNRNLGRINNNLNSIATTANTIAENTEIIEYNSTISAYNTEMMKWLMVYS